MLSYMFVDVIVDFYCFFFFFKQKTAYEIYQCDWSSDVCSSDLGELLERAAIVRGKSDQQNSTHVEGVKERKTPNIDRKSVV